MKYRVTAENETVEFDTLEVALNDYMERGGTIERLHHNKWESIPEFALQTYMGTMPAIVEHIDAMPEVEELPVRYNGHLYLIEKER
jgi:hypothetical protein